MKLLMISNLFPPVARGGAEQVASRIAHEFHARGHRVTVLSSMAYKGMGSLWATLSERHVFGVYRYFPLNLYHMLRDFQFLRPIRFLWHIIDAFNPHAFFVTRAMIRQEQPDAVLTHNLKGIGLMSALAIRFSGIPWVHTVHDVQLAIPSGLLIYGKERLSFIPQHLRQIYGWIVKKIIGSPEEILSPSQFLADFYRERAFFPDSVMTVIPNPSPSIQLPSTRFADQSTVSLLYAGQLESHKGVPFLMDVFDQLPEDVHVHIAGNGALAKRVSQWAESERRVKYHGFVSLQNLLHLLSISDGVVVPSLCYENSPTIIYESFLVGIPVIASHVGGVGELVKDGENGFLFEPGNTTAFLEAVEKLRTQRVIFTERRSSIQFTVASFTLARYVQQLARIIDRRLIGAKDDQTQTREWPHHLD